MVQVWGDDAWTMAAGLLVERPPAATKVAFVLAVENLNADPDRAGSSVGSVVSAIRELQKPATES